MTLPFWGFGAVVMTPNSLTTLTERLLGEMTRGDL
jgi:hypothetical protein